MLVTGITQAESPERPGCTRVSASVRYADSARQPEELWFDLPRDLVAAGSRADPWVAALLPLACKLGEDLSVDAPIDAMFLDGTRELMEWWRYWFPSMKISRIHAAGADSRAAASPLRSAQFFSGGVDSFFTLLRHADRPDTGVDDLLTGWGFDIPLTDHLAFEKVTQSLDRVARALGKRLVPFSTNLRQIRFGREIPWGTIGHGNAMAAVALLAGHNYRRVLIPSTDGYRETGPWGSHATTDHYFSCSSTRVIHDGAAYSRLQKVQLIARSPIALSALRVCWRGQSEQNCGKCEKCLRTMIALELCGGLQTATTFPTSLDFGKIRRIYCPVEKEGSLRLYYLEMRTEARSQNRQQLVRALDTAMRRSRLFKTLLNCAERMACAPGIGALGRTFLAWLRDSLVF